MQHHAQLVFFLLAIILLVSIINPWIFLLTVPMAVVFYFFRRYYMKTGREVKRLEGTARSPVYSHFAASLSGAETIRSHYATERFMQTLEHLQVSACVAGAGSEGDQDNSRSSVPVLYGMALKVFGMQSPGWRRRISQPGIIAGST